MFNQNVKFAKSKGVDLPLMYVYLAGFMSGEKLKETMGWRKTVRSSYRNYEEDKDTGETVSFPIAFLDPYNGKEFESIDKKGLTSNIPANAIYDGDYLSVKTADVIVANLDDFFLDDVKAMEQAVDDGHVDYEFAFKRLIEKVKNYRPSIGTYFEIAWAFEMRKPVILVVPENRREIYEKHPFTCRASQIVGSVDELLDKKVLETFYRRMAGAIY